MRPAGALLAALTATCALVGPATGVAAPGEDLTELSLEQLLGVKVTSVSKKSESLFHAASAIYVLTQEDIRRSGATTIPEALRMVPGLFVSRPRPHLVIRQELDNAGKGETYGIESATTVDITRAWRVALASTWLDGSLRDADANGGRGQSLPLDLRSYLDLPYRTQVDMLLLRRRRPGPACAELLPPRYPHRMAPDRCARAERRGSGSRRRAPDRVREA